MAICRVDEIYGGPREIPEALGINHVVRFLGASGPRDFLISPHPSTSTAGVVLVPLWEVCRAYGPQHARVADPLALTADEWEALTRNFDIAGTWEYLGHVADVLTIKG